MFCHLDYLSQLRDEVLKIVEKLYNEKNALLNKNEKKKIQTEVKSRIFTAFHLTFFSPLISSWHFNIKIKKESLKFYNYLTLG